MGTTRLWRKTIAGFDPSAGPVVPVDPNLMVVTPAPVPRNPTPVSSTSPIARPVSVVRLITDVDADTNCIRSTCKCAHAEQGSEKQSKFLHSCLLRIDLDGFKRALFNQAYASQNVKPGPAHSPARSIFHVRESNLLAAPPRRLPEC
jgi:hypothetical protein